MKERFVILISILILIIGCQISPMNFKYETNLLEGLKMGNELNKPIFLYFTGHGCIGYDEFKLDLIKSNRIAKKLNEEFVSVLLYVDDIKSIEKIDTLNLENFLVSVNGSKELRKAKNRGNVNTIIENELFNNNSQPLYVILDSKNQILVEPFGYTNKNKKYFIRKLNEGISAFRDQHYTDATITQEYLEGHCGPKIAHPRD